MDNDSYPADFVAMIKIRELEKRVAELEKKVNRPSCINHHWELNKRGDRPAVFFSGTNSFMRCALCGHREKV